MSTLIVMRYPSKLFADQADHAYIVCGSGKKAWGCWGGKTGGQEVRRGEGCPRRADAIAGSKERAGITCYLINGVCHQAANRVLLPAGITVRGVRGYHVSEALFGTYGRLGIFPCRSPFDRHPDVAGDLDECTEPKNISLKLPRTTIAPAERRREQKYLRGVLSLYGGPKGQMAGMTRSVKPVDAEAQQVKLFLYMAEFKLREHFTKPNTAKLKAARSTTERSRMKMEETFSNKEMSPRDFILEFNRLTIDFQNRLANTLKASHYEKLFDLKPGDTVILADRKIVKKLYKVTF